ncbi:hypothetical protein [Leptolyngbya sp. PCC 6406]|uniref:hypothetical protein n=1 Tax=Leptolyngbya sp. PCC 6406 TaxID=1173264 RepID=UPI0002AC4C66|nr:hypothetical protein [Leptolyngbya sp. PCC 6406]
MPIPELRPWRLVLLFGTVLLVTAYLPHPGLGDPLPQTLHSLIKNWQPNPAETATQTAQIGWDNGAAASAIE